MEEALQYFKDYEVFIYLALGIIAVWYVRKFALAWEELREAAFNLEKESAQARLNRAAGMLIFLLILGVAEFALVSFVVPIVPGASPLFTPTLDLLATPSVTLADTTQQAFQAVTMTPLPTIQTDSGGCVPGQVMITSPQDGETVSDVVEILGTANIPNFGFYKFEIAAINDTAWQTIQAGDIITTEGKLGFWDTSQLPPGDYALRLVVTDNEGGSPEPCVIQIRVEPPTEP
jgi:hypothetical protein